jgi:hypothetical protein
MQEKGCFLLNSETYTPETLSGLQPGAWPFVGECDGSQISPNETLISFHEKPNLFHETGVSSNENGKEGRNAR